MHAICILLIKAIRDSLRTVNDKTKVQFMLNASATRTQCGAVCWRILAGKVQVLLVTSRDTGRWIIPKGWPIAGRSAAEAAALEAWEEAGVVGTVSDGCIGLFGYDKVMGPALAIPCMVAVYPVKVTRLRDRFPERKERRRKWFTPEKAARKVAEPELRVLLAGFQPPPEPVAKITPAPEKPSGVPDGG